MVVLPRSDLEPRQNGYVCGGYGYYYGNSGCNYSGWSAYGRWVLIGVVIIGAFVIFLLFSCLTARRRRKQGRQPYRMTAWAGGRHGQPQYTGNQNYSTGPPPAYGQQQTSPPPQQQGYYGNDGNQSYFGGQQNDPNIQQPNPAYYAENGANVYAPPTGAPPGKKEDGIIR